MKGIIFNIAEDFIIDNYNEDKLDEIMKECSLETSDPFVGPGTYSDKDFIAIVMKSCEKLSMTIEEFFNKFGCYSFAKLAERFPNFVLPYKNPKDFLKTVDGIIHVEVKKLYEGTELPIFQYAEPSDRELIITYYSKKRLYAYMEGLIEGVAQHFKQPIEQHHTIYKKDGIEFCDFHLKFI